MRVLVIGGSGQIGQFLLPRLADAGADILAVSRQPPADPRWLMGALPDAMPELPPLDAVVSLGPLDHLAPWLSATRLAGTPHVIATSSMSAETKRDSDVPEERSSRAACAMRKRP